MRNAGRLFFELCNMKSFGRLAFVLIVAVCSAGWAVAQERALGVAYYDVDALYDTIPSVFYNDKDYTPEGRMRWSGERYRRKVEHTVAVIDSMRMPIVALRGVESEQVVRDIVERSEVLYSYLHRHTEYGRGKDFALLYYGDVFSPLRVRQFGRALCVEGELTGGGAVAFIVHYRSRDLKWIVEQVRRADKRCRVIVLGGSYGVNFAESGVKDRCIELEHRGMGTRLWRGRWQMSDRIASDIECRTRAGVYIKPWLLDESGAPLATFSNGRYIGGYASNLPVYVYFDEFFVN